MVQRKLTLQLHHQTQTFTHHDAKSPRGADLKAKKMKKSIKTTPNYMKSTTSSDARSKPSSPSPKRLKKKPSFKPALKMDAKRATCSSTLKHSKFPPFLSLNPSGHSAVKVCPYTYCSLNGHRHPPLSSFLSVARRARARAPRDDDDDFFVEIYTAAHDQDEEKVSEEFSHDSFDMDWETGYGSLVQYDEVLVDDEIAQESFDEDGGFNSDAFSSGDDELQISAPIQQVLIEEEDKEEEAKDEENHDLFEKGRGENAEDIIALLQLAAYSKKVAEDGDEHGRGQAPATTRRSLGSVPGDEVGEFNPRGPNFLPVEADPDAERIDLRHQDVDERRNSEEWMVDYALRQVVTKLGPAKKRKVALLVEAFEKVMPLPLPLPPTKFDLHLSHASPFHQMQVCS